MIARRGDRVADPHRLAACAATRPSSGSSDPVKQLCDVVGPDGAVVVLQGATLDRILPQTLRSYCDVPVAVRIFDPKDPGLDAAGFERLADEWKRDGRTLFIVGDTAERIDHIIPGLKPIAQFIAYQRPLPRDGSRAGPTASGPGLRVHRRPMS